MPRIAVLSLTRDRLQYTKHNFPLLRELAGCDYDHYVLDQASTDGTVEWLKGWRTELVIASQRNVGISPGLNMLLDLAMPRGYDVIARFDNDCEPLTDGCLRDAAQAALDTGMIVSPTILGLNHPVQTIRYEQIAGWPIRVTHQVGGIFLTAATALYETFRHTESNPLWGGDDVEICEWHRANGGQVGYLTTHRANHYLTTTGQQTDQPEYFARRVREGGPP